MGDQYSFYWYHAHYRAYYGDGVSGPIVIHPSRNQTRPFQNLACNPHELQQLLRAEEKAPALLLNDWQHELSDKLLGEYVTTGAYPLCVDNVLINGKASADCQARDESSNDTGTPELQKQPRMSSKGCAMGSMPSSSKLSRCSQTCSNTSGELAVIHADETNGWMALHLANTGLVSDLAFSIDGHSMIVFAADGLYAELSEIQVHHCISIHSRLQRGFPADGSGIASVNRRTLLRDGETGSEAWQLLHPSSNIPVW